MALYEFCCKKCKTQYTELSPFDETGKYSKVKCPKCGSKSKDKQMSAPVVCGTASRMERFDYRAGHNMNKAQGERRAAEAASSVGSNPYADLGDMQRNEGLHDI